MSVSTVALGCWAMGGGWRWGPQEDADSIDTIQKALDVGINLFDTAESYGEGHTEVLLGRALRGRRHEAVIASKVKPAHLSRDDLRQACEDSLRRLGSDYIDLYQIHWASRTIPIEETMEGLERLREEGKIRAIGVSNFGLGDLTRLLVAGRCESNQLPYNLLCRSIEFEIVDKCIAEEISILCYIPLQQGILTGKYASPDAVPAPRARTRHFSGDRPHSRHGEPGLEAETFAAIDEIRRISQEIGESMARVSIAWLLHQPGITSAIVGGRTPDQIEQNARAADLELSRDLVDALTEATEEVKHKLGPNPDMWQSDSRFQ